MTRGNGEPPDRLSILHLLAGSDAGGLSRYVFDMCSALHAAGHRVAVAGERGAWHWLFEKAPFPWIEVPLKGSPLKLGKSHNVLRRYIMANPVHVLHTHYRRATIVARALQYHRKLPILYSVHLSHITIAGPRRWLSDFGDHTHCAATEALFWLVQEARVPAKKITYIPHGIHPAKWPVADEATRLKARTALGLKGNDRVAVYVGRLDTPKNERWVIDVAEQGRHTIPNLKILMAGDGPHESQVRKRIAADNLGDRVILLGHTDPLQVYQAADALLLPSAREGFSLVCAEAMAVGVPVLRTKTSGTAELIHEDITGRAVPIDHDAFVHAGVEMLALPDHRLRQMGAAASQHVRTHFTFERQLDQTLALYRRLATIRGNGR
jgi:glycosyltransferase involved in cell wall biosynthesis